MLHAVGESDAHAVHRTRVASRRLREIVPVLQLPSATAAKLVRRIRKVTSQLGSVRELDVIMQLVGELRQLDHHSEVALDLIAADVDDERRASRRVMMKQLPLKELRRLVVKLEQVVEDLRAARTAERRMPAARGWRWAIDARVAKRAGRLRSAIEAAGAVYLPERLHEVRIALKKLRYAVEVSSEAAGTSARADLRSLKARQDSLGRLHDLQRLIDRVRQVQASLETPPVTVWTGLERLVNTLEDECRRLHARYMRDRESLLTLCNRLAGRARPPIARKVTA
jgi:CHAD domain-containing protein